MFSFEPVRSFIKGYHFHDCIHIVREFLNFRPLGRVDNIFQRQRVKVEMLPHSFNQADIMNAADIDPGHAGCFAAVPALFRGGVPHFFQHRRIILDDVDAGLLHVPFSYENHGAG
ncbi:hypothetical protein SDC9_54681 [bioreactor metagenome]|uniref:Uncharacterized protein n=1 Tax=bioreactor metagenome TaxID=1076179 RepID=A0A644WX43_9ZZZZ